MSNLLVLILTTKCGLCSGAVLNGHKVVQCDRCEMWIHTECSFISDAEYGTLVNSNRSWICPKSEVLNFPNSFFFSNLFELENQNRFEPLSKGKGDRSSTPDTTKSSFVKGLTFCSININGIRGKVLELLAFLDAHQPHVVDIQETKIDSTITTSVPRDSYVQCVQKRWNYSWWRGDATHS